MEKVVRGYSVRISLSVVSHGQMGLISSLMQDIQVHCQGQAIELILTLNIPEDLAIDLADFSYPIKVIKNTTPTGFGANHNQAFKFAKGAYFCVLNPDIRMAESPFLPLLECLNDASVGAVAPMILGPSGSVEDSARRFPTVNKLWGKLFRKKWTSDYALQTTPVDVDWAAGMFLLFANSVFERLKGFNERYFLYYEDVDICARLHLAGLRVVVCPACKVVHHAQRSSHRKLKYLRWHLGSMLRFLSSAEYRQLRQRKYL